MKSMVYIARIVVGALKGQLMLAQGSTLGNGIAVAGALKGQLKCEQGKAQLPFQGANSLTHLYPGCCPGLT
jgi:hypothetical protein